MIDNVLIIRPIWPIDNMICARVKSGEAELWVYSLAEKDISNPWIMQRHILSIQEKDDSIFKSSN